MTSSASEVTAITGFSPTERQRGIRSRPSLCAFAPEPDRQQPHEDDEIYFVLEGRGTLTIEKSEFPRQEGQAIFVSAGAEHRFTGYEGLSVLVIFDKSR
jgi:mannose-6-phosphate isomerase-like protein (cupin superfamily)